MSLDIPRLEGGRAHDVHGIRFGRIPPAVGTRWQVTVDAQSDTPDAQSAYLSSYTAETLAVDGAAITRVRVTFERNAERHDGLQWGTVVAGKTYGVDVSAPFVRDEAGDPAPEDEATRVLDVFPDLGTRTTIDQVLPDGPVAVGESRDELAAALLRVIHPRAWKLERGTAKVARFQDESAVFSIHLEATSRNGLRFRVDGEARVRLRDTELLSITAEGHYAHAPAEPSPEGGTFAYRRTIER